MNKIPPHLRLDLRRAEWKTRSARLLLLGERVISTGWALQEAKKPHDLVFVTTTMTDLLVKVRDFQWEWVAERMGMDKRDFGRWPKL